MIRRGQERIDDNCQQLSKNPGWASVKHHLSRSCHTFSNCHRCATDTDTILNVYTGAFESNRQQVCGSQLAQQIWLVDAIATMHHNAAVYGS